MEDLLLLAKLKGKSTDVEKIRIFFLDPGRRNDNGAVSYYVGVYYLEFYDEDGKVIPTTGAVMSASSAYNSYPPYHAIAPTFQYWCTANGNDGNLSKTCWLEINFGKVLSVSRVRIWFADPYVCNNVLVEDGTGRALGSKKNQVVPDWPLTPLPYSATTAPCVDISF